MYKTPGIHHITAITADPQKNVDFYEGFLGQRMIKKTVNFDDPNAYHLYYGDYTGTPGTALTFFYWAGMPRGQRGSGEVSKFAYRIPPESIGYWKERAEEFGVEVVEVKTITDKPALQLADPDGLINELVADKEGEEMQVWEDGPVPAEHQLQGFYSATLSVLRLAQIKRLLTDGLGHELVVSDGGRHYFQSPTQPGRYLEVVEEPSLAQARQGAGSVHHIAFQATDDDGREAIRTQVNSLGVQSTGMIDRQYFHATYFMTPANILFEISTNDIGFTIDEPAETLGEELRVPPMYEAMRYTIEANLAPLELPRNRTEL